MYTMLMLRLLRPYTCTCTCMFGQWSCDYQRVQQYSLCRDGMEKNGRLYTSIASERLKSLVIYMYTDKF